MGECDEKMNLYKESMCNILKYIGLSNYGAANASMPPRSEYERQIIASAYVEVEEKERKRYENLKNRNIRIIQKKKMNNLLDSMEKLNDECTIYLSFEESLEWKAFLHGLPVDKRHFATVRRRLSLSLWKASCTDTCLFCWFPRKMCICSALDRYREQLPMETLAKKSKVTMLLHGEELMRSTNSGHIAAYILGSPLRIWGLEDDDMYLKNLKGVEELDQLGGGNMHNVSLYPEKGAPNISEFITQQLVDTVGDHQERRDVMHLILSDSTWSQALSLNRHIPREVTRVALEIKDDYESLFTHLRKRTRETGVSTLEATTMAVEQCLCASGYVEEGARVKEVLVDAMKEFVDIKCLLKFQEAPFCKDGDEIDLLEEKRDDYRRECSDKRYQLVAQKMETDAEARKLLLPPVLNYCYCCDRVIGWHRMPEHVLGKNHLNQLEKNPNCIPTAHSKEEVVYNFSRPMRAKRMPGRTNSVDSRGSTDFESGKDKTDKVKD